MNTEEKNNFIPQNLAMFGQAKKQVSICNLSNFTKITLYGPNASDLINKYSIRNINKIMTNAFYTVFLKKKKYLEEILIIRLSGIKYLLIFKNNKEILKILNNSKRLFPLVTVDDTSKLYAFFSFHGDKSFEYFQDNKASNLYRVQMQHYTYYVLLSSAINKFAILDHFKSLGFFEITLETRDYFLYNNNVLTNLDKLKRSYRIKTILSMYNADNITFKVRGSKVKVLQFEATKNLSTTFGMNIYSERRKVIGYVHNFYRLPHKKNPYILGVIKKELPDKIALLINDNNETIIKEYQIYN